MALHADGLLMLLDAPPGRGLPGVQREPRVLLTPRMKRPRLRRGGRSRRAGFRHRLGPRGRRRTNMPQRPDQLPVPSGIAFDLDGTLVDTVGARIDGWLEALAAAGMRTTRDEVAPMIGMDGKGLARDVAEANHRRMPNDEIEKIDSAAGEAFDRLNTSPRPLPGAADLLGASEAREAGAGPSAACGRAPRRTERPMLGSRGCHLGHPGFEGRGRNGDRGPCRVGGRSVGA